MWWAASQKNGCNAKSLQRLLGLRSYHVAWEWLHKIRQAMALADQELGSLKGLVEVGMAFIGDEKTAVGGRKALRNAKVFIAVGTIPVAHFNSGGCVRLQQVMDFSVETVTDFVFHNVDRHRSFVFTDSGEEYRLLRDKGFIHKVRRREEKPGEPGPTTLVLPHVQEIVDLLRRWLRTHRGAIRPNYLQRYLDEFAFHHNRRNSRDVDTIFYQLVEGITHCPPANSRPADAP